MIEQIQDGRCDLVFRHVAAGGSALARDSDGVPLIRWCAYYGDVSAIRFLLSEGEQLDALGPNLGLGGAAFHGHWQLCQFLIEQGADVNRRKAETHETALHSALSRANRPRHVLVVSVLLAAGAEVDATTLTGVETGCFMRDARTRGETALHRAAAFGSEEVIGMLLDSGASPSARDCHGDTPLSWASWHLRPAAILRRLCFDGWTLHPDAAWTGDHGAGWGGIDLHLLGRPLLKSADNIP